jgi:hypothetical protein
MKKLLFILSLFIVTSISAQTKITAPLITNSATDTTYSVTADSLVKGGYRVLVTNGQRDSIPSAERKYGMLVYVKNTDTTYQLKSATLANDNWYAFKLGSLPSNVITGRGVIQDIPFYSGVNSLSYTANLSIDTASGTTYYYIGKTTKNNYIPLSTDPSNPSVGVSVYSKTLNGFTEPYYIDSLGNSSRLSTVGASSKNNNTGISPLTPICLDSTSSIAIAKGSNSTYQPFAIALDSIPNNGYGRIVYNGGLISGLPLSAYKTGQNVYLGDDGGISPTPSVLYPAIKLGVVTSNTTGSMLVAIDNVAYTGANLNAQQTTVNASTSGSVVFSMTGNGSSEKKVIIYCNNATGTATYSFPSAFTHIAGIIPTYTTAGSFAVNPAIVTSLSTTSVTLTCVSSTGVIILNGF